MDSMPKRKPNCNYYTLRVLTQSEENSHYKLQTCPKPLHCCDYSLEAPHWHVSNEDHNNCLLNHNNCLLWVRSK